MKNQIVVMAVMLVVIPVGVWAAMSSTNFQISTTVMSGGGGGMASAGFGVQSVLGQPTPVALQQNHPASSGYLLYPGFMYTLQTPSCFGDLDEEGDVDGHDIVLFIGGYPGPIDAADLERFASEFGRQDCR